jgi:hypothetical protein
MFKTTTWEKNIALLKEYKKTHGHFRGVYTFDMTLARYIAKVGRKKHTLTPEQVRQAEDLGFMPQGVSTSYNDRWDNHIKELLEFKKAHGHCDVPNRYEVDSALTRWVNSIRNDHAWKLSPARRKQLDELGFQHKRDASTGLPSLRKGWREMRWKKHKAALLDFQAEHGHCNVPSEYPDNRSLGSWARHVRNGSYKITYEQAKELEEMGFPCRNKGNAQERWEKNLAALSDFQAVYGHCYVPIKYPDNPSLGIWSQNVRSGSIKLTDERAKDLEELGYDLEKLSYDLPKRKMSEHVHTPQDLKALDNGQFDDSLETGLSNGVTTKQEKKWVINLGSLRQFKIRNGNCNVPSTYPANQSLSNWVTNVRSRNVILTENRKKILTELGFDFIGDRRKKQNQREGACSLERENKNIDSTEKISQQTQKEGSSPLRKMGEHVDAPQDFQALNNGQFDDSLDIPTLSSGVSDGEKMAPKVDRKKCLEEDFMKANRPRRNLPSQVRTMNRFLDAVPMFKAQDLRHYGCSPFDDSVNESLSSHVSDERSENIALMEDDEMQDLALMVDDEIHQLEKLRFASRLTSEN